MEKLLQQRLAMGSSKESEMAYNAFLKVLLKLLKTEPSNKFIDKEKSE